MPVRPIRNSASRPHRTTRTAWALAILLGAAACGGAPEAPLRVEVATSAPAAGWLADSALEDRTRAVARIASERWGGADLDGWTIRFVSEIGACGAASADGSRIQGCTRPSGRVIEVAVDPYSPCVEATALLHEVGHVALPGDAAHADRRWSDGSFWSGMLSQVLAAIAPADAACSQSVTLWRLWWGASQP